MVGIPRFLSHCGCKCAGYTLLFWEKWNKYVFWGLKPEGKTLVASKRQWNTENVGTVGAILKGKIG